MEREQEETKQREIDALQNQLQQLKDMAAGKAVSLVSVSYVPQRTRRALIGCCATDVVPSSG